MKIKEVVVNHWRVKVVISALLILAFLSACDGASSEMPPTAQLARTPTESPPTETPTAVPQATVTTQPESDSQRGSFELEVVELQRGVVAGLPPTPTPDASGFSSGGITEVSVLPLVVAEGSQPLWAVFSIGARSFGNPPQHHFVAIYTRNEEGWQELARLELSGSPGPDEAFEPSPDYLFEDSVGQANLEPSRIWLEVHGGAGAHSGVYHLLSFDGYALRIEATNFTPSPGADRLEDMDGDGVLEVVLDASDPYVFCYACGVRLVKFTVLRWDGSQLVEVPLRLLPESAPVELRDLNDLAVELAQAGLWKDALATIEQALALGGQDATIVWNAALIHCMAKARQPVEGKIVYPLLEHVFYGDYTAALDVMRAYSVGELFGQPNPLVAGTVAEGFEAQLAEYVQVSTIKALQAQPDLAGALFLRGWAAYLNDPGSREALADIERAAGLDPGEPLFAQSVTYLK